MPVTLYVFERDGDRLFSEKPHTPDSPQYVHYDWEECLKRWPRLCSATAGCGYWTPDEVGQFIRDYRWFKALGNEARTNLYLRHILYAFKTRHISKRIRRYFASQRNANPKN